MVRAPLPGSLYKETGAHSLIPISCARACTVASEVFTEAQSFADCKLHIRTRLLASAFSNFWKLPLHFNFRDGIVGYRRGWKFS